MGSLKVSAAVHAAFLGVNQKITRPSLSGSYVGIGGNLTAVASVKASEETECGLIAAIDLDRLKTDVKRVAEVYAYLKLSVGSLFIGGYEGPAATLMHDAADVVGGSKGPLGFVHRVVDLPIGCPTYTGLRLKPSNKIGITTTSMGGLIVGLSYSPDEGEDGRAVRVIEGDAIDRKETTRNIVEVAANFTKSFSGLTFGLYASGVFGKHVAGTKELKDSDVRYNPLEAYQIGALFDVGIVRVAGGYLNYGKSLVRTGTPFTAPSGFNVGVGITLGSFLISSGYYRVSRDVEKGQAVTNLVTLAVDYAFAPGVTAYAECDLVDAKTTKAHASKGGVRDTDLDKKWDGLGITVDNKGPVSTTAQVFILGLKVQC